MNARRSFPLLLLCLLVGLTAGGVALGLVLAPAPDTLAVNNGAGEDLLASSLVALGTQQEVGTSSNQAYHATISVTPPPAGEPIGGSSPGDALIYVLRRVSVVPGWANTSGVYHYTGTPVTFLGAGSVPAGATLNVQVTVHDGYATFVSIQSRTSGGQGINESFRMLKIGAYRPPANLKT